MTQPSPTPHLHCLDNGSETMVSVRRNTVIALNRYDGAYDYDTGLPTQFYVIGITVAGIPLRVKTFGTAQDRDDYIAADPDGLLA